MLATVGGLLAKASINIGALSLGRTARGGQALALVTTDDVIPQHVLEEIASIDGVSRARIIQQ
jgi:D-3-phosphoglycerate dehydrogenase